MSDLKFSCPSCKQHIQCDEQHTGENIPCPSCAILVRVPATATIVEKSPPPAATNPFDAESKASYTPTGATAESSAENVPTLEENISRPAEPVAADPLTERDQQIAAARAHHAIEVTPSVKPRLSFILSGGEAPVPQE